MRLYSGMSRNFIDDTVRNQIAGKLEDAFFRHFRYRPSPGDGTDILRPGRIASGSAGIRG